MNTNLNCDDYFLSSYIALSNKEYGKARVLASRAIIDCPLNRNAPEYYAFCVKQSGKIEDSLRYYQQSTLMDPSNVDAYFAWGNALKELGKLDEAIDKYEKIIDLKPNQTDIHNAIGLILYDQQKYKEAIHRFTHIRSLNPSSVAICINIALCYYQQGEIEDSKNMILQAIALIGTDRTKRKQFLKTTSNEIVKLQEKEKSLTEPSQILHLENTIQMFKLVITMMTDE